jgi:hypothetical protein
VQTTTGPRGTRTGSSTTPSCRYLLGATPVRSELVHALVQLDRDYGAESPDQKWEDYYAERLVERFAG